MDAGGIEHILRELGCEKIRVHNNTVHATCPFAPYTHAKGVDRHPSFGVDINAAGTSKWGCFACKNGANQTYSLVYRFQDYTGILKHDLLDFIRDREGQSLSYRLSKLEWRPSRPIQNPQYVSSRLADYEPTFQIENYKDVLSYLPNYALERHITPAQAIRWKLGWLRYGMILADGYKCNFDRLFFTIIDHQQKMVGWSGRIIESFPPDAEWCPPKYHHAPEIKKERYLYGENFVDQKIRHAFVVESFMDVLNLDRFGVKNVLAIMGSNASFMQITKLSQWFDKVYVLRHDDQAGQQMAEMVKVQLDTVGTSCEIVEPLPDRKDCGEWIESETLDVLKNLGVLHEHSVKADQET